MSDIAIDLKRSNFRTRCGLSSLISVRLSKTIDKKNAQGKVNNEIENLGNLKAEKHTTAHGYWSLLVWICL